MNLKFENRYYTTDKMLSEYVQKVLCRRLYKLGSFVIIVGSIALLFSWMSHDYIMSAIFGSCLFISLFVVIAASPLTLKQLKDNEKHIHNGKKFETVIQFGDNILITEGTFSLTVEYAQIQKIYPLKHTYVLMFGKSNGLMLSPEHFSIGTFDDFQVFIKTMCSLTK